MSKVYKYENTKNDCLTQCPHTKRVKIASMYCRDCCLGLISMTDKEVTCEGKTYPLEIKRREEK